MLVLLLFCIAITMKIIMMMIMMPTCSKCLPLTEKMYSMRPAGTKNCC